MTIKLENESDDDYTDSLDESTNKKEKEDKWDNEVLDRMDMLKARFGIVRPGTEELHPDSFFHHWKVDDKIVNQGQCYFNDKLHTYYVRPREPRPHKRLSHMDTIYFEIERENINTGHDSISFYMTGNSLISTRQVLYRV